MPKNMSKSSILLTIAVLIMLSFSWSCRTKNQNGTAQKVNSNVIKKDTIATISKPIIPEIEQKMIAQGLVNIQNLDSTIMVELKYSTTDNFVHTDVYGDLTRAYLQTKPAQMLAKANQFLKEKYPNYRLLVYDAARPLTVQYKFWNLLDSIPPRKREDFVSNPKDGSIHNYGSAVDLTVYDLTTKQPLDMGTKYDFFGDLAYPRLESVMLKNKKLTQEQINNRLVLRDAMKKAGFGRIESEWWHFNAMARVQAKALYKILE
jgi:zinc D-Ala-D-Ala dipeptidase